MCVLICEPVPSPKSTAVGPVCDTLPEEMETCCGLGASSLPEYVLARILAHGDAIAQVESWSGRSRSFKEVWRRSLESSRRLKDAGLEAGSTVGICLENGLEYVELLLGVLQIGAVAALYPPASTIRELDHLISISRPSVVFGLTDGQVGVLERFPGVSYCPLGLLTEGGGDPSEGPVPLCPAELSGPALLLASSGSTGLPKAVVLRHSSLIWSLSSISGLLMERGKPALGLMPFYHAYGLGLMLMALCQGTPLVIMNTFSLNEFTSTLTKYKISHLHIVPSLLVKLGSDGVPRDALKSVRAVFTGAGAVTTRVQSAALDRLDPQARLYHSYGMTETTHIVAFAEVRTDKPGSPGRIISCMKAKILGRDGEEVEAGERGELCLQGPLLTPGYLNNPSATEETFTSDRWLKTGDLASIDKDGYLFIVDRIKDIIKYQGYQISVTELEQVIIQQRGVNEVAVIGVEHDIYGEVPKAFIVADNMSKPTEEEIQQAVSRELSHYKWLRGGVKFVNDLPKTQSMKINRKLLRSMH